MVHLVQLSRQRWVVLAVAGQHVHPVLAQRAAAGAHALAELLPHAVRHQELRVLRPAVEPLGGLDLLVAQRLPVRLPRPLLLGRAIADDAVHHDEGRAVRDALRLRQRGIDGGGVVGVVHVDHVPAIGGEAGAHVLVERQAGRALDGDVVAVVDPHEVGQLEVPGSACGFRRHTLHHVAVAAQGIDAVAIQLIAGLVVAGGEPAFRHRHADRVGDALAQRPRRRLHARGVAVFRVARRHAAELAELLDVVQRHSLLLRGPVLADAPRAGQVQQRIEQHGGVPDRQYEAVPVGPGRVHRVEPQAVLPQRVGDGGHSHRGAGVAGFRFLHRIHRQRAYGVDAQLVDAGCARAVRGVAVCCHGVACP